MGSSVHVPVRDEVKVHDPVDQVLVMEELDEMIFGPRVFERVVTLLMLFDVILSKLPMFIVILWKTGRPDAANRSSPRRVATMKRAENLLRGFDKAHVWEEGPV